MTSSSVPRSERDLTDNERGQLRDAHAELRAAVNAYEPLTGSQLNGEPMRPVDGDALRKAQERLETAEDRLWRLREQLLGWARPSWAPRASLVSDWFSDEDAIYDQVTDATAP